MRVMLVNGSLFGGGAEHVIATLARRLRETGITVTIAVIHRGGEVQRELEREQFDVVDRIADGAGALTAHTRLAALIADRRADVVHSHDLRSLIDAGLCRLRSRRFAHIHTFHFGNYPFVSRKHLLMEGLFARVPDRLVAVGHVQRASIIAAMRLRPERISTVWNGVDRAHRGEAVAAAAGDGVPIIGSMSTLGPQKGVPTLLEAAARLKARGTRFHLMIVGEGAMRPELEAQRHQLGLDADVTFTGWRPDAATALLPTFDIFVQSSYWEAMSVVILEAMACGRPIVATTVGENTRVLEHGRTALLVPPNDPDALAHGLGQALADPALRQRLAAAARAEYVARLTGAAMAGHYASMYREVVDQRRALAWPAPEPRMGGRP